MRQCQRLHKNLLRELEARGPHLLNTRKVGRSVQLMQEQACKLQEYRADIQGFKENKTATYIYPACRSDLLPLQQPFASQPESAAGHQALPLA